MAIVQISQITQRKGLQVDLPQLAGAEFGWSIDERRLFIGNGTLEEGAPVVGNTEILTEFSDIFAFQSTYTYKGEAAGYIVQTGPTPGTPVTQSLQSWLDQFATVKDFGAVGDGQTDDTDAINRALQQLFCREINPQIRRSLFFPAGVYRVSSTIIIPPFATLYGEGRESSVIVMAPGDDSAARAYVARTGDSLQQTGVNIGNNGAIPPQNVTIANMGFQTQDADVNVFLVEDLDQGNFTNVSFAGPLTTSNLNTAIDDIAGVRFASTVSLICNTIEFNGCSFSGLTYGLATEEQTQSITVTNSKFDTLYQGIVLGDTAPVNGGPTGFRIVGNLFDNIYEEGVVFGDVSLNMTANNIFYDVSNNFQGVSNPAGPIIRIDQSNNVSVSDMFERTDAFSTTFPRISLGTTTSIATTNGVQIQLGTYTRKSGLVATLVNNTSSPAVIFSTTEPAFAINYRLTRDTSVRNGVLNVTNTSGGGLAWTNDFVENTPMGIFITCSASGSTVNVNYTATNTGVDAIFSYSMTRLY